MRKRVNKYLPKDVRELAMWSISLLVNTSTWIEMKENWRLVCRVFLSYAISDQTNLKLHQASLLSRISKITSDPNSSRAIDQSKQILMDATDPFQYSDDDDDMDDFNNKRVRRNKNFKTNNKTKQSIASHLHSSKLNKSVSKLVCIRR